MRVALCIKSPPTHHRCRRWRTRCLTTASADMHRARTVGRRTSGDPLNSHRRPRRRRKSLIRISIRPSI